MLTIQLPAKLLHLRRSKRGLYYHTCAPGLGAVTIIQRFEGNANRFTPQQIEEAHLSRAIYKMVGIPSPRDFKTMLRGGMIRNCPITPEHLKVANSVFGPNVGSISVKTVRRKPDPFMTDYVDVSSEIIERNSWLEVSGEIMFLNKITFLITIGHRVKFITAKTLLTERSVNC